MLNLILLLAPAPPVRPPTPPPLLKVKASRPAAMAGEWYLRYGRNIYLVTLHADGRYEARTPPHKPPQSWQGSWHAKGEGSTVLVSEGARNWYVDRGRGRKWKGESDDGLRVTLWKR